MGATTVKVNATTSTADPTDLSVGINTVVGRVAGDIVAAQVATSQIADNAVTFAKLQDGVANTVIARAAATNGDVAGVALAASQLLGRGPAGDIAAIALGTNLSITGTTLNAGGGITVSTMNDLRALNPSTFADGTVVTLLGYVGPSDGGGGDFSWRTGSPLLDDGGCIIQPTSIIGNGRFIRIDAGVCLASNVTLLGSEFNVRWFGAIPVFTDCTPGFLLASAAAKRVSTYAATIYFPPGYYKFESPVDETYDREVTIKGDGPASNIECAVASAQAVFAKFTFTTGGGIRDINFTQSIFPTSALHGSLLWVNNSTNVVISRVQIFGSSQQSSNSQFYGNLLKLTNNQFQTVSNVLVRGNGTALKVESGSGVISDSIFVGEAQTPAMWISDCNSLSIQDSFFQGG
jgi:hypothetical protein